jgi:SAP domain
MAAPRTSSFKALRNLQKVSRSTPTKRDLHITGVHAAPSPIDPTHKTTYTPWSMQDLRGECSKRSISASGTKHELIDRLAGHDSLQARAFSMAMRRISREQTRKSVGRYDLYSRFSTMAHESQCT